MSVSDPKRLSDGSTFIARGVQSGVVPDMVGRDQLAFAINTILRPNVPVQRPGIIKRALVFPDQATQTAFQKALWQGAQPYSWGPTTRQIIASVGGRQFQINPRNFQVQEITLAGDPNPAFRNRAWMEQAEMFMIVQDGQSPALIWNGSSMRRASQKAQEVPTGTVTRYALARLWVVLPDGRSLVGGDITPGPSGTAAYGFRDAALKFTENTFVAEGGAFSVRGQQITAMQEIASIDTTLGQGPLQVFTSNGTASLNVPFDRTLWKTVQYPVQTFSVLSHGALAQDSTIPVNNDIWYRANDGFRSFQVARREAGGSSWGNVPMSLEMRRILDFDQTDLLGFSSAVLFDNRLIQTCSPVKVYGLGTVHRGLVALDFSQVSSLARDKNPAYDGLWTGLQTLKILSMEVDGVSRCFIFAVDPMQNISLYELTTSALFDGDGTQRIPWTVEYGAFDWFENVRGTAFAPEKKLKQLIGGELSTSALAGTVNYDVRYRQDRNPNYRPWNSWSQCASQPCGIANCFLPAPNQPQYRRPALLPAPSNTECDPQTGRPYAQGFEFQPKIKITGPARIDMLRMFAYDIPEPRYEACLGEQPCLTLSACIDPIFDYKIN